MNREQENSKKNRDKVSSIGNRERDKPQEEARQGVNNGLF
jgi:hypothetical protein